MNIELIAHNIRSLYNVGSMFRNADGFGVSHVYLTGYTGTPPRDEISKVALGADEAVEWSHTRDVMALIESMKADGKRVVVFELGVEMQSIHDMEVGDEDNIVVVFGNEPDGLSKDVIEVATDKVSIPMHGTKTSLNVAVASGVALFAMRAKCYNKEANSPVV